jgi:putative transposase
MPWRRTLPDDERLQFVVEAWEGLSCITDLCATFGVSTKTGHKWLTRFEKEGPAGLVDRSRAPHTHPQAVAAEVVERLLDVRRKHPRWGPRKILAWLTREEPTLALPAASTIAAALKRHGMVHPRRLRRRVPPGLSPFASCEGPNDVWAVDFKGNFRLGDGTMCYPLTITDAHSRFLLCCEPLTSTSAKASISVFEATFRRYGLPDAIRSDNGTPFASTGLGGFTALSAWWLRLGIRHDRIQPGRPDQNGRHERMHLTLKQEALAGAPAANLEVQRQALEEFRRAYNEDRPHEAIGQCTPASLYTASTRPLPATLPLLVYPAACQIRLADHGGYIGWHGVQHIFLGHAFARQPIGLSELDDGLWQLYLGDHPLGTLREGQRHIQPPPDAPKRRRRHR